MKWSTSPWWEGLAGSVLDGAVNVFGQKINADASVSNTKNISNSITGVVKFIGIVAAFFAGVALLFKIFK